MDLACSSQECPSPRTMPTAQQLQAAGSTVVHPVEVVEAVAVQSPYASIQASQLDVIELTAPSSIRLALI